MVFPGHSQSRNKSPGLGKRRTLLILDMNGVLILRNKERKDEGDSRPYLEEFLYMIFEELKDRIEVAVWSSMMEHNLYPLVKFVFGEYAHSLAFVWDQKACTEKWVPGLHKPLLRKDLHWLRQTAWSSYLPGHVLLVDDDPIKCTANQRGTALHPTSWNGERQDWELRRLSAYLKVMTESGEPVPEFQRRRPFEEFWTEDEEEAQEEDGAELADAERPAKRQRIEDTQPVHHFAVGEDVEAFWPDDEQWLPAAVIKVIDDGDYRVAWREDGTESVVPAEFVRRKAALRPPPGALRVGGSKAAAGASTWKRIESTRSPGVYYYYDTKTGKSQPDPPAPWQTREVPGQPGKFRYVNFSTGQRSAVKPEV